MKPYFALCLSLLISLGGEACSQPLPTKFVLGKDTELICGRDLSPLGEYAAGYLGVTVSGADGASKRGTIALETDPSLAQEGFRLEVTPLEVTVTGGNYGGVFNGLQSLFRLLPAEVYGGGLGREVVLRDTLISSSPRFAYRGLMLDVARTWIGFERMKRYIDLLAYHNINKLHLHLTDDEGWRLEIKSHPELTSVGGFRGEGSPVEAVYGKWGERYGGFYTREQMRALIDYAAVRNIEIIPEIDLPGHSRNIASVYPEIRCNYAPDTVSTVGYDYRSAWCVAREENYRLLDDILSEVCTLFPSKYIHVGGDEVDLEQWSRCPDCRRLMQEKGFDDPHRLEDYFLERVSSILARHGKYPGVWDEAVKTGAFTRESRVYAWHDTRKCLGALENGYQTVIMPGEYFYLDMRQSPTEDGHDWAGIVDARKLFSFDFERSGITPGMMSHVAGFEAAFWSEAYISHNPERPDYLDYMCFPRLCALSRLAWSGNGEGWDSFYEELVSKHYDRLTAMGVRYRLFPPKVTWSGGVLRAEVDDGSRLCYKEEGSDREQAYTGPIRTAKPHLYQFRSHRGTGVSPWVAHESFHRTVKPAVKITSSMAESRQFPMSNAETYRGMTRTARASRRGDWILYTFAQEVSCREMYLQTGNRQLPKAIITRGRAEVLYAGEERFVDAGELFQGSITLRPSRPIRAVRLVSEYDGNGTPFVSIQPLVVKPRL